MLLIMINYVLGNCLLIKDVNQVGRGLGSLNYGGDCVTLTRCLFPLCLGGWWLDGGGWNGSVIDPSSRKLDERWGRLPSYRLPDPRPSGEDRGEAAELSIGRDLGVNHPHILSLPWRRERCQAQANSCIRPLQCSAPAYLEWLFNYRQAHFH